MIGRGYRRARSPIRRERPGCRAAGGPRRRLLAERQDETAQASVDVEPDVLAADMTDAETAFIRAEQDHANSIYDYLTALARLEYAMGVSPEQGSFRSAE